MKVDRRVAIGAIAGGMLGMPLALKAYRSMSQRSHPDPTKAYAAQLKEKWTETLDQVATSIQNLQDPSAFSLKLNVPDSREYTLVVLEATFPEGSSVKSLAPDIPPLWFGRARAQLRTKRIENHDVYGLSTKADLFEMYAQNCDPLELLHRDGANITPEEYVFVPKGDRLGEVILRDGSARELPGGDMPSCCALLSLGLWPYYPGNTHLKTGAEWLVPSGVYSESPLPCKIAGFARVDGKTTAVISCETTNTDFRESRTRSVATTDGKNTSTIHNVKWASSIRATAYIDIATGLAIRQELRKSARARMPDSTIHQAPSTFVVSRIFDA